MSSQLDNMSFGVSLASSPSLFLSPRASAITDVSSQGALLSSRFSSFETQSTFSLISKSVNIYIFELQRPCSRKL